MEPTSSLQKDTLVFCLSAGDAMIGGADEKAAPWSHRVYAPRQRDWLERQLVESTADWKVVVGHYPVWLAGRNVIFNPFLDIKSFSCCSAYCIRGLTYHCVK
jgi:hypothetical protein